MLEREIGVGGMAQVFLARDEILHRLVAVKILKAVHDDTDTGARFRREGRTAAKLSHPNVVTVYGAGEGEFEGREASYIVMEYVPGGDLKALIDKEGFLENTRLARLGAELSYGLAHAHEKGVIHRDIKPHNVLLDSRGRPKLSDFGIARALDATTATQAGSYLGTALYSSPEQLRGEKVTPKSDVYSLGMALYQAAAGQTPFNGTPIEVASQHVSQEPATPSDLGASLSDEVETLILDCIHKDPDHRPSAEEVHERLLDASVAAGVSRLGRAKTSSIPGGLPIKEHTRSYSSEASTKRPPPGGALHGSDRRGWWRRGPALLAAAALLLVMVGVAYATTTFGYRDTDTAYAPQEEESQQTDDAVLTSQEEEGQQEGSQENMEGEDARSAGGAEDQTPAGVEREDTGTSAGTGGTSEEDPAQVVREFYETAVERNFGRHSATMTQEWRQIHFPEQNRFQNTYSTLQGIEWAVGPTAVVSGNTATVTGVTIATHTNRTERNAGTWTLVYENGEWRINGWDVNPVNIDYT